MHCVGNSRIWLPTDYSTSGLAREPHQVVTDVDTDKQRELQRVCVILNHLIPATTLILEFLHGVVKTVSLFSFSFSSLKISCMHTMCLGHLSLKILLVPPTHTYNTKSAFKLIYVFTYKPLSPFSVSHIHMGMGSLAGTRTTYRRPCPYRKATLSSFQQPLTDNSSSSQHGA